MMQRSGAFLQSPIGVIVVANVIWHIVVLAMGIKFNWIVSLVVLVVDFAAATYLLDKLTYFFSQFILPVQTPKQRKEIFKRVSNFGTGNRGPALFIKNGEVIMHEGEADKMNPDGRCVAECMGCKRFHWPKGICKDGSG